LDPERVRQWRRLTEAGDIRAFQAEIYKEAEERWNRNEKVF